MPRCKDGAAILEAVYVYGRHVPPNAADGCFDRREQGRSGVVIGALP
jgi:hypothetical protein